jgi:4-hydroxy-tetrahydrodipicolinate reductase
MGQEAVRALAADPRFEIAGLLVRRPGQAPADAGEVYTDAQELMVQGAPQVWLDFTDATSVVRHIDWAVEHGIRPVVGATGYTPEDVRRWDEACRRQGIGGIAAPNFAIGALLMMRFAAEAARFFSNVEIVELHHDGKKDAPSGTARRTAEAMAGALGQAAALLSGTSPAPATGRAPQVEPPQGARGLVYQGVPIHSVRLPGLVAHQEVIFGGTGEVLTIRHDSLSRASFMPGVLFACSKVMEVAGMVYGLEHLLW